jgi:hypothetical protein
MRVWLSILVVANLIGALGAFAATSSSTNPPPAVAQSGATRPACPPGWTDFQHPLIGMQAYVPGNYWVRLRGGLMLTVEKQGQPAVLAFLLPFKPRAGARAAEIAERFGKFAAESEPRFQATVVPGATPDLARASFKSAVSDQPVEGKYYAVVGAGGTMAYIIGVMAPAGRLDKEMPILGRIARSFAFVPPQGKWTNFQSPAGGFTMTLPEGWTVESGDGRSGKDNIDWVARDPRKPLSRAFQWCPRYCSPQMMQDLIHPIRGYQPGQFQSNEQIAITSLGQISQDVQLLKFTVNQPLTQLCRKMNEQVSHLLALLNAGRIDVTVYDCLARAQVDGKPVLVAFVTGVQTMAFPGAFATTLMDYSVTLRGWCAEPDQFVADSPVLEKICVSMQLTPAFINRIVKGNEQASRTIRETYDYMNKIDDQIRQSRWDTMDAIAEMSYDVLRDTGGYVNESTGRIEQIAPEKVVKNGSGELVSREEVERGVSPDSATVLRDARSAGYMRGVYGRIEF